MLQPHRGPGGAVLQPPAEERRAPRQRPAELRTRSERQGGAGAVTEGEGGWMTLGLAMAAAAVTNKFTFSPFFTFFPKYKHTAFPL